MTHEISNSADILDSRDVEERISELEDLESSEDESVGLGEDELEELEALRAFRDEVGSREWKDGLALIRDSYFEDYAREFAEDIGAIPDDAQWPCTCIDWEHAARELQMDYSSAEFDGVTYWFHS